MYLPIHNASPKSHIFKIRASGLCIMTVSMPLLAFIACVLFTMYKDFDRANDTHCKVPNIFPSISASIGNYEPQKTLWRTAIYINAPLRLFIIYNVRWKFYKNVVRGDCIFVVKLAVILNIIENLALLGLTVWTSSENYPYHEMWFKIFIGTSIFYMFLTCVMLTKYRRRPNLTKTELKSVKYKWRAFLVNVISFTCAAYFFLRHNKMCEPYAERHHYWTKASPKNLHNGWSCATLVLSDMMMNIINVKVCEYGFYSMFGFSEYVVVISNIAFHLTTVFDLQTQYIYFTKQGIIID